MLDGIYPEGLLNKTASYHTSDFFTKYWEPIVRGVGHFCLNGVVLTHNHPSSQRRNAAGWDLNNKRQATVNIHMDKTSGTWLCRQAQVAPQNWNNAQVRCVKKLPSYYQRTGIVKAVANRGDYLDISVDFGRGLGKMTLTNNDLEYLAPLDDDSQIP
jgi:hypothetical protein